MRSFGYDANGRQTTAVNPESGTTTLAYDSKGLLTSKTTPKGTLTYEYDSLNRLWKVKQGATVIREYAYDSQSWDATFNGANLAGRLAAVKYGVFVEVYSYTSAGLPTRKRLRLTTPLSSPLQGETAPEPPPLEAQWAYDNEGRVTQMKYPDTGDPTVTGTGFAPGTVYSYYYDTMGRPLRVNDGSADIGFGVAYNAAGADEVADVYGRRSADEDV